MVEAYKPLYTVKETAGVLKCNTAKVYELLNYGKIPYLILGQKKIRGSDLERFIEQYPAARPETNKRKGEGGSPSYL